MLQASSGALKIEEKEKEEEHGSIDFDGQLAKASASHSLARLLHCILGVVRNHDKQIE